MNNVHVNIRLFVKAFFLSHIVTCELSLRLPLWHKHKSLLSPSNQSGYQGYYYCQTTNL